LEQVFVMTMAAAIEGRTAKAPARSKASRIAQVDIITELGEAESIWRAIEGGTSAYTPYQRFDFLAAWQRRVGDRQDVSPLIVVAYDAERRPLLLLPLAISRRLGVRVAAFMGGKHPTFNMALWDKTFAAEANAADLEALLSKLGERANADVLALTQQPKYWRDLKNPIALLGHQPSVNICPVLTITAGAAPTALISNSLRRRLKGKERKLEKLPGYRHRLVSTEEEITRLLDWYFRTKPLRMAEQKLPNVFGEPGVEEFVREACSARVPSGRRAIEIHALECDEEVIALFAGVADGERFSMMFNTYTMSGHSRYSPGLILIRNIVDHYAAQGFRALDLGIGSDDYKRLFCKDDEPLFDCFVPLSGRGKPAALAMSWLNRTKRVVKQNQALLGLVQRLRGTFN
jgi:CelD/BcsL family acetyltransferase involved in cellulose biosynthesis